VLHYRDSLSSIEKESKVRTVKFPNVLFSALGLVILFAAIADADDPKPTPVNGKIKWVYDYEDGKKQSLESGKPMFVVIRCER